MNVIDMHCDTISVLYDSFRKRNTNRKTFQNTPSLFQNSLHIDLQKMQKGGYILQNFALYVHLLEEENPMEAALSMTDLFYEEMRKNSHLIRPVTTYEEIIENHNNHLLSALLTLEEGEICKGNLAYLRNFYRLGVRMMTLTWNFENQIGYPNLFPKREDYTDDFLPKSPNAYPIGGLSNPKGLKEKGLEFLSEMERLGMIIDVSHLSDGGFYDVYQHTVRPFVASHSNARSICPNCRNLTDDMIRKMGERGCVIGLNYVGPFLTDFSNGTPPKSTVKAIVRHAKHITNLGGTECLGLGSDFDGFEGESELYDCSAMELLADEMKKQGFSSSEIEKIFYQNVLNLYREILSQQA